MKWIKHDLILACVLASLSGSHGRILDMTHDVSNDSASWPNVQKKFTMTVIHRGPYKLVHADLQWFEAYNFESGEHVGTHMDAPVHFAKDVWSTNEIPLDKLIGPAVRVDIRERASMNPDTIITKDDILAWEAENGPVPENAIVFQCSGWGQKYGVDEKGYWGNDIKNASDFHFPGFGLEAAKYLVDTRKISGLGVDTPSLDTAQAKGFEVHVYVSPKNIFGIEHAKNTCELPAKGATVYVMPMKLQGGSGGPIRLMAIWGETINGAEPVMGMVTFFYIAIIVVVQLMASFERPGSFL